jgi:hypothetical protein
LRSSWRLFAALQTPASVLLPDRPRIRYADETGSEPTLAEYVAMAIEIGDAAALDHIATWMRQFVTRGADEADWPNILRSYRYTADALRELADHWDQGQTGDADLIRRIQAAGLDVRTVAECRRQHKAMARRMVAREHHVSEQTIRKMWKRRATILPEEGTVPKK